MENVSGFETENSENRGEVMSNLGTACERAFCFNWAFKYWINHLCGHKKPLMLIAAHLT